MAGCVTHLVIGRHNLLFSADEELARVQGDPIGDAAVERFDPAYWISGGLGIAPMI